MTWPPNHALTEYKRKLEEAERKIPEGNFGHDGWKRYISIRGQRKITFDGVRISTGAGATAQIQFACHNLDTGKAHANTFWVKVNGGDGIDLAKGESHGVFELEDYLGVSELHAWGSKAGDLVFYLKEL